MKGNDLLKGLTYVDDSLIKEAEEHKLKKSPIRLVLPLAASFALTIAVFTIWSNYSNHLPLSPGNNIPPIVGNEGPHSDKGYILYFNEADSQIAASIHIEGHFWEELTSAQIEGLFQDITKKYKIDGTVNYSYKSGSASVFNIDARFNANGKDVKVTIAPGEMIKCYLIEGEPIFSEIEGVNIEAGIFITDKNSKGQLNYIYYADFKIDDIAYNVEYIGNKDDKDFFTNIIADIVLGGKADLSVLENPVVPKLRSDRLTEIEAYGEKDFGAYLLKVPNNYTFNDATRFVNQNSDFLSSSWSRGYDDIRITISKLNEQDKERIVSLKDTKLYDMSLYPIPWAESMPRDKANIIENPIFKIEELTIDILKLRGYTRNEQGGPGKNIINMRFSVLYDDILVEVNTEGVSYEYLFNELSKIPHV
ncbi:MAG: hypothetical protein GX154_01240 [Clostridiales bacterium]|nr:hypothetical protein [Clostridiales bacterium]